MAHPVGRLLCPSRVIPCVNAMSMIITRHELWKVWVLVACGALSFASRTPGMAPSQRVQATVGMALVFGLLPGLAMFLRLLGRMVRWSKTPWRPAWREPWWKLRSNWMAGAALVVAAVAGFLWSLPFLAVMFTWSYQEARAEERRFAELGYGGAKP